MPWNSKYNLVYDEVDALRVQVAELEDQRNAVLAYVAELECLNCEHPTKLHDDGSCTQPRNTAWAPKGSLCGCSWGNETTDRIREIYKTEDGDD